jgi:hypothetical protein
VCLSTPASYHVNPSCQWRRVPRTFRVLIQSFRVVVHQTQRVRSKVRYWIASLTGP